MQKDFKYGMQIPRNDGEAKFIDDNNSNTHWQAVMKKEVNYLIKLDFLA